MSPVRVRPLVLPTGESATPEGTASGQNVNNKRLATGLQQAGGQAGARTVLTAAFNVSSALSVYLADTTSGAFDGTLPMASEYPFQMFWFKRVSGANTFRVLPRGADTIDGAGSLTVTTGVMLIPKTGSAWTVFP